ncbi:MAG: NADH-quinone oxidoreductase subunit J [Pyrinomonadaceae bacterium]
MTLSGWEAVFFWIFSSAALLTALLMVMARNAVHSALFLISCLVSVAALFVLLGAEFIAGVQVLIYVGGVMVLFLFVIMLVNVSAEERGSEGLFHSHAQVAAAIIFSLLLTVSLIYAINQGFRGLVERDRTRLEGASQRRAEAFETLPTSATGTTKVSRDTEQVGFSLYRFAALPFEIASVLLLVAVVGAVMLARTRKQELAADDVDPDLKNIV